MYCWIVPAARGNETDNAFGRWLDSVIPAIFETDASLARAIGCPQSTIHHWRRGTTPSVPYLLKLSKATGTSTDTLLKIAGYQEDDQR
jgi:transcriptional regulator with XRE-family HTH domain